MMWVSATTSAVFAAAEPAARRMVWEIGREGILVPVIIFVAVVLAVGFIYRADTKQLAWGWKLWLLGLRVTVLAALLVVARDLQTRTETRETRPSRVDVLVDTTRSMDFPDKAPGGVSAAGTASRAQAAEDLLANSPLLKTLRQTHQVQIFTFDEKVRDWNLLPRFGAAEASLDKPIPPVIPGTTTEIPPATTVYLAGGVLALLLAGAGGVLMLRRVPAASVLIVAACLLGIGTGALGFWVADQHEQYAQALNKYEESQRNPGKADQTVAEEESDKAGPDWKQILDPKGNQTRLGEAVTDVLRKTSGETLSGVLVISDGGNNSGYDARTAHDKAVAS